VLIFRTHLFLTVKLSIIIIIIIIIRKDYLSIKFISDIIKNHSLTTCIMNDPNTTNQPQPPSGGSLLITGAGAGGVFFSGGFLDRILLAMASRLSSSSQIKSATSRRRNRVFSREWYCYDALVRIPFTRVHEKQNREPSPFETILNNQVRHSVPIIVGKTKIKKFIRRAKL